MIFRCEPCQVSCFTDIDPADDNQWPVCATCDTQMRPVPDEELFAR